MRLGLSHPCIFFLFKPKVSSLWFVTKNRKQREENGLRCLFPQRSGKDIASHTMPSIINSYASLNLALVLRIRESV